LRCKKIILGPKILFAFALQIHDEHLMGAEGSGDNLEAERFPPEYLLDGGYTVLLFWDAATGVGRIDEHYFHGSRPWWICWTLR
jgi:hypothetical protein